jgi:ankyrin repeat protein
MNKYISLLLFCTTLLFSHLAKAQEMPAEMQALCKRAETEPFVPAAASIERPHPNPLYQAIGMGAKGDTVKSLLAGRHPDEIVVPPGVTPLMYAAVVGNWSAAKALIEIGANMDLQISDISPTVLESGLLRSHYSLACKLIESGIKLPTSKKDKGNLLSEASLSTFSPHEEAAVFVNYLLSNGFDANDLGSPLETPLMGAVSLNNIPVIKVLLKHGARLEIAKRNGLTVWDVARRKNNPEVLKILREAAKQQGVQEPVNR